MKVAEVIGYSFLCFGSFWVFVAALGVVRFSDLYCRMHAATKASSFGLAFILIGASLFFSDWIVSLKAFAAVVFVFVTNPISAHLISRAAHRAGYKATEDEEKDDLKDRWTVRKVDD